MTAQLTGYRSRLLEDALKTRYSTYTLTYLPASNTTDNYLGVLIRITVVGVTPSGSQQTIHLIVKTSLEDRSKQMVAFEDVFEREIHIYTHVLPAFRQLARERGIVDDTFSAEPQCYGGSFENARETVILEDMKMRGFLMSDRTQPLDYAHCKVVVEFFGRLHAYSFALRKDKPEVYAKLTHDMVDLVFSERTEFINFVEPAMQSYIQLLDPDTDKEIIARLQDTNRFKQDVLTLCDHRQTDEYSVIGHGDCWLNNYLFRYEENSTVPVEVCAIDFQMSRNGSPGMDLAYLMCTATDRELRGKYYHQLLTDYHASFSKMLIELGGDPSVFSIEILHQHMKRTLRFGLVCACVAIKIFLDDGSDTTPLVDLLTTTKAFTKPDEIANKRVTDLMRDLYAMDVL